MTNKVALMMAAKGKCKKMPGVSLGFFITRYFIPSPLRRGYLNDSPVNSHLAHQLPKVSRRAVLLLRVQKDKADYP